MATILSGVLAEEVAKELLEEVPLLEILPVILYDEDELLLESSFLAHEIMLRQNMDIKIMFKIFLIINLLTLNVKIT
ncbi:MAG: hypothetical protein VYE65_02470 [SAR324 cluster bacterium]|nr:hypothetical protein [SAR324 cluster bacterium]